MIHLILGRQGSGKTLFLVKKAYEFYKQGKAVYSNVALNFPYEQLDYNDIVECKLKDGIVIIDEAHLLLSARASMQKRNRLIVDSFISQVRKNNLELYMTTQTARKIDVRIREESDFIYICDRYAYIKKKWLQVLHNQNLDSETLIMIKLDVIETFSNNNITISFIGNPLYELYDTRQIIKIKGLKY